MEASELTPAPVISPKMTKIEVMEYIDADKLITEIEMRNDAYQKNFNKAYNKIAKLSTVGRIASLKEQPEVDLEKEAKECWDYIFPMGWDKNSRMVIIYEEFMAFARHFYEVGFNARRED